jgi:hypothetical protein
MRIHQVELQALDSKPTTQSFATGDICGQSVNPHSCQAPNNHWEAIIVEKAKVRNSVRNRTHSVLLSPSNIYSQAKIPHQNTKKIERLRLASSQASKGPFLRFGNHVLTHTGPVAKHVDVGIFIGGPGHNWFHWLVELLPTIFLAHRARTGWADWPLLVPEEILAKPNWRRTLEMVAPQHALVGLKSGVFYSVGRLVILAPPTRPGAVDFGIHLDTFTESRNVFNTCVMAAYRNHLRSLTPQPKHPVSTQILLSRPEQSSRQYNHAEIIGIAEELGFETLVPEKVDLIELWSKLSIARIVIGPQGAAWANSLVCGENSYGLQWAGGGLRGSHFDSIAALSAMPLEQFVGEGDFNSSYRLDPVVFRSRLATLVKQSKA